ncbi:two-component regulator propeller domain-containing protein [Flavipsychrobacter stenotrophus]|nr:two-component regulator propeller domain-containing protein [Flavipsychrobacter stenotrophus]
MKDQLLIDHYYDGKYLVKIALPHTSYIKDENKNSRFQYDIYSTLKDRRGNIWFGTCTAGVCKYDGKEYTWIKNNELGVPVRSIFEDKMEQFG